MIKVLSIFSLQDDEYVKYAERLYAFPIMNNAGFDAYGGSSYFPYLIMIKYLDD